MLTDGAKVAKPCLYHELACTECNGWPLTWLTGPIEIRILYTDTRACFSWMRGDTAKPSWAWLMVPC